MGMSSPKVRCMWKGINQGSQRGGVWFLSEWMFWAPLTSNRHPFVTLSMHFFFDCNRWSKPFVAVSPGIGKNSAGSTKQEASLARSASCAAGQPDLHLESQSVTWENGYKHTVYLSSIGSIS